jgi:hypothetical protein
VDLHGWLVPGAGEPGRSWRVFARRGFAIAFGLQTLERAATGGGDAARPAPRVHHRMLRGRRGQELPTAPDRVAHAQRRAAHEGQPSRDFELVIEDRSPVVAQVERRRGEVQTLGHVGPVGLVVLVEPDHAGEFEVAHVVGVMNDSHRVCVEEGDPVKEGRRLGGGGCCGREFPAGHAPILSKRAPRSDGVPGISPPALGRLGER